MYASIIILAFSALASAQAAKPNCTVQTTTIDQWGRSWNVFYDPTNGLICDGPDCGGGRAPPKSIPGCGLYKGTETHTYPTVPGWGAKETGTAGQSVASVPATTTGSTSTPAMTSAPSTSPPVASSTSSSASIAISGSSVTSGTVVSQPTASSSSSTNLPSSSAQSIIPAISSSTSSTLSSSTTSSSRNGTTVVSSTPSATPPGTANGAGAVLVQGAASLVVFAAGCALLL